MNKTIIQLTQLDGNNNPIGGSVRSVESLVVNTCCISISCELSPTNADLQYLRTRIDEKAQQDIDTSGAEAKYNEAKQKIDSARLIPPICDFIPFLAHVPSRLRRVFATSPRSLSAGA